MSDSKQQKIRNALAMSAIPVPEKLATEALAALDALEEQLEALREAAREVLDYENAPSRASLSRLRTALASTPAIIPSSGVAVDDPVESGSAGSYANREPERATPDPASEPEAS